MPLFALQARPLLLYKVEYGSMENLITYILGIILLLMLFYFMCEIYFFTRQRYIERVTNRLLKDTKANGKANT